MSALIKYIITNAPIESVEKGSINSNPENPVIAFTVNEKINNKKVKCIVKGSLAKTLWDYFLADNFSMDKTFETNSTLFNIERSVRINFTADFREEREKEVVLQNIDDIKLTSENRIVVNDNIAK